MQFCVPHRNQLRAAGLARGLRQSSVNSRVVAARNDGESQNFDPLIYTYVCNAQSLAEMAPTVGNACPFHFLEDEERGRGGNRDVVALKTEEWMLFAESPGLSGSSGLRRK